MISGWGICCLRHPTSLKLRFKLREQVLNVNDQWGGRQEVLLRGPSETDVIEGSRNGMTGGESETVIGSFQW